MCLPFKVSGSMFKGNEQNGRVKLRIDQGYPSIFICLQLES